MSNQIDCIKTTVDELIKYNESKVNNLINQRASHIRTKQAAYYESKTKHKVLEIDNTRKEALAELEAKYNAEKADINSGYEKKRTSIIEKDYAEVALTEGAIFDTQIAKLQSAIEILKGGAM